MEALFYFAIWAALIFLMMRFGHGAYVMGHGQDRKQTDSVPGNGASPDFRWVPPEKDMDPVCKKIVATDKAKPSVYDGSVYYFCSRDCREVFEAAPDLYVGTGETNQQKLEHSHV
jgi:YHS domain-containing protein